LYWISPPVVYYDMLVEFEFDPKSTVSHGVKDLRSDELPFVNAKINNALVDFEFNVDHDRTFSNWNFNSVRGRVGDQPVGR
jgi:hypothetical protein